jgi:CRP/FNR family transcriptional regulator, nitrogen fixation regulation protein
MDLNQRTCGACRGIVDPDIGDHSPLEQLATVVRCNVDDIIYHREEQTQYWYLIVIGAARKCSLTTDGRRQILDFLLPGDLFGFGARDIHHFSTEVITAGTTIARYPRRGAEELAERDLQVAHWLREKAFQSISRLQARTLILGRTSALARVSAFLLEWADRCNEPASAAISLPMSRYDIADYLAMAVETVSRALTVLRTRHVITFRSTRRLSICDRRALEIATDGGDEAILAN